MARAPATGVFRPMGLVGVLFLLTVSAGTAGQDSPLQPTVTSRLLRPGRHVCTLKKDTSARVKRFEAFRRPVYQSYAHRCQNKICRGVRVVYETAYRHIADEESQPSYRCCPGWAQEPRTAMGCTTPVCTKSCQNNGTCVQPDQCNCPTGFTGQQCENDIDECAERRPCSQLCINSEGSYHCACRPGFRLAPDLHTCIRRGKKASSEGRFDVDILAKKISKLEKLHRKSSKYELQTELSDSPSNEELQASFDNLHKKLETLRQYQQEKWAKLEEDLMALQPLCARLDSVEQRLDQCACKCKDPVFSEIYP